MRERLLSCYNHAGISISNSPNESLTYIMSSTSFLTVDFALIIYGYILLTVIYYFINLLGMKYL